MNKTFIKTKPLISLLIASSILTGLPAVVYANSYKNEEIRLEDMRKEKQDIIIECFSLINSIRIENNLEPLTWVEELEDETYLRASEASIKWSHTRPSGQAWYTVNPSLMDGENLATGYWLAEYFRSGSCPSLPSNITLFTPIFYAPFK